VDKQGPSDCTLKLSHLYSQSISTALHVQTNNSKLPAVNNASIANGAEQTVQNTASEGYTRSADQDIACVYRPGTLN
jgi:hypothetical protein